MTLIRTALVCCVWLSLTATSFVYAESAPVYDADAMERQFQNSLDQGADLPPPPAPSQFVQDNQDNDVYATREQNNSSMPMSRSTAPLSVEERMRRVEQQMMNMQNSEATQQVTSLQNEVQALRGQVEVLTHQIQQLQNQQNSLPQDKEEHFSRQTIDHEEGGFSSSKSVAKSLDIPAAHAAKPGKPSVMVKTPAKAVPKEATSEANQPDVAEEQQIYQTAYTLIKAKKYNDAVKALQGMLKKYPSGQFASNAHYWLGELYGLLGKSNQALDEFSLVVKQYPHSPRVSDAQLKVGLIQASQFKWKEAKVAFKQVINHYPGSGSSKVAAEQLKQIKLAGH